MIIPWYDIANSYLAGYTFLINGDENFNLLVRHMALICTDMYTNFSWSDNPVIKLNGISTILKNKKIFKTKNYFNKFNLLPLTPIVDSLDESLKALFNKNKSSSNFIENFNIDFYLYDAIQKNNYTEVKELIENYSFNDSNLHNGVSYISNSLNSDKEILSLLLESGFDPDITDNNYNNTSLHLAVASNSIDHVNILLEHGMETNLLNSFDISPLGYAIEVQNPEIVNSLLEYGADPDIGELNGITTFASSFLKENYEIAFKMIESTKDINQTVYNDFKSIHFAASFSDLSVLKKIIQTGAELDPQTNDGSTAVLLAEKTKNNQRINKVKLLLDSGADANIRDKYKRFLLFNYMYTETKSRLEDIKNKSNPDFKYIWDKTDNITLSNSQKSLLAWVSIHAQPEMISEYLEKYPDEKLYGKEAYDIILQFLERDQKDLFLKTILRVENLEYRDEDGSHILYDAITSDDKFWAVEALITHGYNISLPGYNDWTGLEYYTDEGMFKEALWLIDNEFQIYNQSSLNKMILINSAISQINNKFTDEYKTFISELKKRNVDSIYVK